MATGSAPDRRRGRAVAGNTAKIGGGAAAGAAVAEQGWVSDLVTLFADIIKQNGPAVGLALLITLACVAALQYLLRTIVTSKDDEINRLVEERNRLFDEVMQDRPSTQKVPRKATGSTGRRTPPT